MGPEGHGTGDNDARDQKEWGERIRRLSEQEWLHRLAAQEPGAALRAMRVRREMTQEEVAEFAEISVGYLSHLESMRANDVRTVSRDVLMAIATGFSARPSEFNVILQKFNFADYAHTRRRRAGRPRAPRDP